MPAETPPLSPQELACLSGVAQLKRSKEIARELELQPDTVDTYIRNATKKLGVTTRMEAARVAVEMGLVSGKSGSGFSGVETDPKWRLPLPFPTRERPRNELNASQTIVAILIAALILISVVLAFMLGGAIIARSI